MEKLFWIGFVGAIVAGLFAVMQAKQVMSYSEGTERMQKIAQSIREGANAYLKQQYTTVAKVFIVVFIALLVMAFASGGKMLSIYTPFAFVTGGVFSMLAGFIGMKIATASNARTAKVLRLFSFLSVNKSSSCSHAYDKRFIIFREIKPSKTYACKF